MVSGLQVRAWLTPWKPAYPQLRFLDLGSMVFACRVKGSGVWVYGPRVVAFTQRLCEECLAVFRGCWIVF